MGKKSRGKRLRRQLRQIQNQVRATPPANVDPFKAWVQTVQIVTPATETKS